MNWEDLHNKYTGERLFFIGNGPSLEETPLELIKNEYTFGLNRIDEIYKDTSWRPTFYFFINNSDCDKRDKKSVNKHISMGIPCFINLDQKPEFGSHDNVMYFNEKSLHSTEFDKLTIDEVKNMDKDELSKYWSDNPGKKIYSYHSTMAVIQIAQFMGFDTIYLLGVDLGFQSNKTYMVFENGIDPKEYTHRSDSERAFIYDCIKKGEFFSLLNGVSVKLLGTPYIKYPYERLLDYIGLSSDTNHFSSSYRQDPWDLSNIDEEHIKSHVLANCVTKCKSMSIYNATYGGELEVYERIPLEELVN
jgi:hypothetical protein